MNVSSPDFHYEAMIPAKFTCEGKDISPELNIEDIPEGTKSMALIMYDPDAPRGTFIHWVAFNISPKNKIKSGEMPGTSGINDFGKKGYGGPCPPKGTGTHRYFFNIYALKTALSLKEGCTADELKKAMKGSIIAEADFMGKYTKDK